MVRSSCSAHKNNRNAPDHMCKGHVTDKIGVGRHDRSESPWAERTVPFDLPCWLEALLGPVFTDDEGPRGARRAVKPQHFPGAHASAGTCICDGTLLYLPPPHPTPKNGTRRVSIAHSAHFLEGECHMIRNKTLLCFVRFGTCGCVVRSEDPET